MGGLFSGGGFTILKFFLLLMFGVTYENPYVLITEALQIAGIWKILEKSGIHGWWALIPGAGEYQLSRCAGREPEGRTLSVAVFVLRLQTVLGAVPLALLMDSMGPETAAIIVSIIELTIAMVVMVYSIRVYSGLTEVYGRRKRWLFLWIFAEWLCALIWGFRKDFQPAWKVTDMREEMEKLAFQGSAAVMDEGLTVNLTERTVTEFFQKKTLLRDIHMSMSRKNDLCERHQRL